MQNVARRRCPGLNAADRYQRGLEFDFGTGPAYIVFSSSLLPSLPLSLPSSEGEGEGKGRGREARRRKRERKGGKANEGTREEDGAE
jgi:hypothetical protein